jgi:glutamyl-tRNA synthetase
MSIRVRFAPSPTGFLHIGGVRTALFNWLLARKHKGQFLLRIEDTDLERSEKQFTDDIMASMKWLGLNWDEEPIFQSKRLDVYKEKAEELVEKGFAYRCTCSEEAVEKMREKAQAEQKKPQYDRTCRDLNHPKSKTPYVIRAKIPLQGQLQFTDLIRGDIKFENLDIDDFVLIRTNGAPTYNLSNVVDDVFQKMTHIIRGDDHINNTPKQVHLYQFFKFPIPNFAHLPMILGADKKKLSKRHGAVSANVYRADGYLPEALLNFLARLGWSHGDQEVFSIDEMIQHFSFDHVQKSSAVFNVEKLLWTNGVHIRGAKPERLRDIAVEDFRSVFADDSAVETAKSQLGVKLAALIQPKVKTLKELAEQMAPLCAKDLGPIDTTGLKWAKDGSQKPALKEAVESALSELKKKISNGASLGEVGVKHADVEALLRQICEQKGLKLGDLAQPMRLALTGKLVSAGLFDLMEVLPWTMVESRLAKVKEF